MEEPDLINGLAGAVRSCRPADCRAPEESRYRGYHSRDHAIEPVSGTAAFREDEEYLFFGREPGRQDGQRLALTRFLAVVGTSGSGKSSLVNSGLGPALRRGLMARAGTAWRMVRFRPGS